MQNRYAGDIGDYVKLAMLRRVAVDRRLGIIWWLYPDENHNADGKHVAYLDQPTKWRPRDPDLFDSLKHLVSSGQRSVAALKSASLLPGATLFEAFIPTLGSSLERRSARSSWYDEALAKVSNCDLVFLDPDNGLETATFTPGGSKAGKSVALHELELLKRPGRTIIIYHHQTRMAGGHLFELKHWGARLARLGFTVQALRASAFSARAFFFLDAPPDMQLQAESLAREWGDKLTWHPDLG